MNGNLKKMILVLIAVLVAGAPALLSAGDHGSHHAGQGTEKNPLVEEMLILDNAFREVVSGVSLGDGARVHKALEAMHGTMEKTHEGVHSGHVKIPKNADRFKEFVSLDKKFHSGLEELAIAAHKNDRKKMLSLTVRLLNGCVHCHNIFRG